MPLNWHNSLAAARKINELAERGLRAYEDGEVEQEPQLTDRIFGSIQAVLEDQPIEGLTWNAHTLSDRGRGSSENKYGADALVVLDKNVDFLRVKNAI